MAASGRALYTRPVIHPRLVAALLLGALLVAPDAGAQDPAKSLALVRPKPALPAKEFLVATPDNRQLRLSEFKGKVVFLNFWATWCKPCEEEMPSMERLHRKFKDQGLVVLALSEDADGAAAVMPFLKKHNLTFPVGLDNPTEIAGKPVDAYAWIPFTYPFNGLVCGNGSHGTRSNRQPKLESGG